MDKQTDKLLYIDRYICIKIKSKIKSEVTNINKIHKNEIVE